MGPAVNGVNNSLILKTGLKSVQSGEIFSVKIISNKNGLIKLALKGRFVSVKGDTALEPGKTMRVRAEWAGKTLILRQLDAESRFTNIITGYGLKPDAKTVLMFRAAADAGLPLNRDTIRLIRKLLRSREAPDREEARTAAELIKKGIDPSKIIALLDSFEQEDRQKQREASILFNHLQDAEDKWFIVPLEFSLERTLQGVLKFSRNRTSGKLNTVIITSYLPDKNKITFFIENFSSKNRRMKLITSAEPDPALKNRINKGLSEILGNLALETDDNNSNAVNPEGFYFDGFSTGRTDFDHVDELA